jgi:hypothetical protein
VGGLLIWLAATVLLQSIWCSTVCRIVVEMVVKNAGLRRGAEHVIIGRCHAPNDELKLIDKTIKQSNAA